VQFKNPMRHAAAERVPRLPRSAARLGYAKRISTLFLASDTTASVTTASSKLLVIRNEGKGSKPSLKRQRESKLTTQLAVLLLLLLLLL
jgi:hypothetical protein